MTDTPLRLRRARKVAAEMLRRCAADDCAPVPIEAVARLLNAEIVHGDLDGALALVTRGTHGAVRIRLSDRHEHPGQARFSIAHELGHLLLDHPSSLGACTRRDMNRLGNHIEAEANAFAGEALMPAHLARRHCEVSPVNLEVVRALAETFEVSLVAAAIRFVELASERCAVVLSQADRVRWAARSETFWPEIPRGKPLLPWSLAHGYFARRAVPSACEPIDATAWIDGQRVGRDEPIFEHAAPLPQLGAVLSLLWIPESSSSLAYRHQ